MVSDADYAKLIIEEYNQRLKSWGDSDTWGLNQFKMLEDLIAEVTHVRINANTLKRFFQQRTSNPQLATKNALCVFLGYSGYSEFVIKHTISIAQMLAFVDNVVSSCFHDEGYMPEVKDLLIKSNLLTRYANFTLPENLEHRYTLIYNTDAVAMVSKHISSAQFDEILRAIDEKIDYICNTNIMAIEKQMQQLVASFEDVSKKTSEMFAVVNGSDIAKLIGAIDKGGVDEQKLVQAFLEQREDYKE